MYKRIALKMSNTGLNVVKLSEEKCQGFYVAIEFQWNFKISSTKMWQDQHCYMAWSVGQ